jgi:YHS domain-containing protein
LATLLEGEPKNKPNHFAPNKVIQGEAMKKIFYVLTIACALAISAAAHEGHDGKKHDNKQTAAKGKAAKSEFKGKGDGVETCPVTGEPITNKDVKANMFGRTVYFCCESCRDAAKKNPERYLKP